MSCQPPNHTTLAEPTEELTPEGTAAAAAWRLLELQARDAAGWAPPALDYARGELSAETELRYSYASWAEQLHYARTGERAGYFEQPVDGRTVTPKGEEGHGARRAHTERRSVGSGPSGLPQLPEAVVAMLEYRELLRVFLAAKATSPENAGGIWWAVRMEARSIASAAAEAGQPIPAARAAMLTYEAAICSGLAALV